MTTGLTLMTGRMPTWPTEAECHQIRRALAERDVTRLTLRIEESSPWLSIIAWIHMVGDYQLALWRTTGAVYELDSLGAVMDDPIIPGAWEL